MTTSFLALAATLEGPRPDQSQSIRECTHRILSGDIAEGRIHYAQADVEIVKIPSPRAGLPSFFVHGVPGRSARPQHPSRCPLCLANARETGQHYVIADFPHWPVLILANPFAYLPECITWAIGEHLPQHCGDAQLFPTWRFVFETMLTICSAMCDHVIGFNESVGNSLDHLHFVSHRPPDGHGPYAAQQVFGDLTKRKVVGTHCVGPHNGYPTIVWRVAFTDPAEAAAAAVSLVAQWQKIGGQHAAANCAAIMENSLPVLYIFPRTKLLKPWGWMSSPAFVEMLGVFIATEPSETLKVRQGFWGYEHFVTVLASLCPPGADQVVSIVP